MPRPTPEQIALNRAKKEAERVILGPLGFIEGTLGDWVIPKGFHPVPEEGGTGEYLPGCYLKAENIHVRNGRAWCESLEDYGGHGMPSYLKGIEQDRPGPEPKKPEPVTYAPDGNLGPEFEETW